MLALRETDPAEQSSADGLDPFTIAIAVPSTEDQRVALAEALGPACRVVDIREAPPNTALVVVPPCSARALKEVMHTFPRAGVIVIEGLVAGVDGPVSTVLGAGALGYAALTVHKRNIPHLWRRRSDRHAR